MEVLRYRQRFLEVDWSIIDNVYKVDCIYILALRRLGWIVEVIKGL